MTKLIKAFVVICSGILCACTGVYHQDTYPVIVEHERNHPYMHGEQGDVEMYPEGYER